MPETPTCNQPTFAEWTSPSLSSGRVHFKLEGCLENFVIFALFRIETPISNREDPNQTPRSVASNLGLHCLSTSQKMGRQAYMG